jgi:hypothetical protein
MQYRAGGRTSSGQPGRSHRRGGRIAILSPLLIRASSRLAFAAATVRRRHRPGSTPRSTNLVPPPLSLERLDCHPRSMPPALAMPPAVARYPETACLADLELHCFTLPLPSCPALPVGAIRDKTIRDRKRLAALPLEVCPAITPCPLEALTYSPSRTAGAGPHIGRIGRIGR